MFPRLLLVFFCLGSALSLAASPLDALVRTMAESPDPALQLNVLRGINAALKGKRNLPPPAGWDALYAKLRQSESEPLRQQAQMLAIVFGGESAFGELRAVVTNPTAKAEDRQAALEALANARDAATLPLLLPLLSEAGPLRRPALRSLAAYDDPQIAGAVLGAYASLNSEEKRDALAALARRAATARALLAAVDAGQVARTDLTAPFARQLQGLHDAGIAAWLKEHWGAVHTSSADKLATIAKLKAFLTPEVLAKADANHGRALFAQTCALCHTLFGAGAKIGPELPGAFEDIDYLLQNIVDPNAIIGKDYQQTVVQMKKGETVIGIIGAQDGTSLTLKTLAGPVIVQRGEVEKLSVLDVSLMPEGLISGLPETDVRDLFGYLRLHGQVPALLSEANLNDFNEDHDFARWSRSGAAAWKMEDDVLTGQGSADRAEFITSDLVADSYRMEMDVQMTGPAPVAEIAISGREPLRLTGKEGTESRFQIDLPPGHWRHFVVEESPQAIEVRSFEITARNTIQNSLSLHEKATGPRVPFTFRITGAESGLKIRNLRLSPLHPAGD